MVERPDGTRIVEHADGTRVTTFYKQVQQEIQIPDNETGEQAVYSDISKMFVKVECTGFPTLIFDSDLGSCETVFGNGTKLDTQADGVCVMTRPDGTQLHIEAKGETNKLYCSIVIGAGARFSKVPVAFRARSQILKSKSKE